MFYLLKNEQIAAAETFDRATALVAQGWALTTRAIYLDWWRRSDAVRLQELVQAAVIVPPRERTTGGGAPMRFGFRSWYKRR